MTLDLKTSAAVTLNFDKVQGLRDLEDTALSLSAHCKSSLRVIEAMREISGADFQGVWSLNSYNEQLLGNIEDLSVLTSRIGNTIDLVSLLECETVDDSELTKIALDLVRVCPRLKEPVHGCRYQPTRVKIGRRHHTRHSSCEVDHILNATISARQLCCGKL